MRPALLLAMVCALPRALLAWPSCKDCVQAAEALRAEWRRAEPALRAELPRALCRGSSMPSLCESAVAEGLDALNATLRRVNGSELCADMRLCDSWI